MSWSCSQVRRRLALYAGGDLTGAERQPLTLHLKTCPSCHRYHAQLEEALAALGRAEEPPYVIPEGSLWPELRSIIASRRARSAAYRYWTVASGWATAACVIVALAISLQPRQTGQPPMTVPSVHADVGGFDSWLSRNSTQPTSDTVERQRPWPGKPRRSEGFSPGVEQYTPADGFEGSLRYVGHTSRPGF